ncbi:general secretion pathway protein M [Pseudomonas duriflava]|uniref:General secretion pathway protein M n=1 Tax=Pseudomonas duriflava TaxID=459528 RepID=A0A562QIU2_9PSED|nr:type II secretion system protein GspM [Pseudomonas duriflava]TWI56677.1 general secretion pathway protein M [Pseudomonas duriflava]
MRRTLTPRESRIAALLVLALTLCLVYWAGVHIWFIAPHQAIDEQMETLRQTQLRYQALLAQREPLQEQLEAAQNSQAGNESLLPGDDPSVVAAGLMQHTAEIIEKHRSDGAGCELLNRTPIAGNPGDEPYAQVKVSVNLSCAIQPLEAILYDLETNRPFLFIEELRVERHEDAPSSGGAGRLEVQMLVTGYMQRRTNPVSTEELEQP